MDDSQANDQRNNLTIGVPSISQRARLRVRVQEVDEPNCPGDLRGGYGIPGAEKYFRTCHSQLTAANKEVKGSRVAPLPPDNATP